jgi:hypothetical protein
VHGLDVRWVALEVIRVVRLETDDVVDVLGVVRAAGFLVGFLGFLLTGAGAVAVEATSAAGECAGGGAVDHGAFTEWRVGSVPVVGVLDGVFVVRGDVVGVRRHCGGAEVSRDWECGGGSSDCGQKSCQGRRRGEEVRKESRDGRCGSNETRVVNGVI